jgi:hypothetical protein
VTTESFAPGSVDQAALDDKSVGEDQLQNDSVGSSQLQDGSVGANQIANGAVTNSKLASNAVTEAKIDNGAVTQSKIADNAVTASKIAADAVGSSEIASGAVGESELADNAVTRSKIATRAVDSDEIENYALKNYHYDDGSITKGKISGGTYIVTALAEVDLGTTLSVQTQTNGVQYTIDLVRGSDFGDVPYGNHTHSTLSTGDHTHLSSGVHSHTAVSSKKYKKNIENVEFSDPLNILSLQPVKFKYKNSKRQRHDQENREWMYGYIAEDVFEKGLEEVVGYDDNGEIESLDYSLLTLRLVEVLKIAMSEIEDLKSQIQNMKGHKD